MAVLPTTRFSVWRALLDGDCKLIHKTEVQLWRAVKDGSAWYEPENDHRWTAFVSDEDVFVVTGVRHDWGAEGGSGGVHVHYICPYCGIEEYCDDDPDDQSPYLWFCERGKGVILVQTD